MSGPWTEELFVSSIKERIKKEWRQTESKKE